MKPIILLLGITTLVGAASFDAKLDEAKQLAATGQMVAADTIYEKVIADAANLNAAELSALGLQFHYLSRYRDAELLYRQSLSAWAKLGPETAHERLITSLNLGTLLRTEGRFREAEMLLRNCLEQAESADGPESVDAGRANSSLAALYLAWGELDKSEHLAVHANAIFSQDATATVTEAINNRRTLASVYLQQGQYHRAEELLRSILESASPHMQPAVYNDLAVAALHQDQIAEAEALSRKALDAAEHVLPPGNPIRAAALNNLAQSCRFQGRFLEAEKYYRQAIAILEESFGRRHPDTAKTVMNLAAFYHERGREVAAEDLYRRVDAIFESAYGPGNPLTLVARDELAEVLRAERRFTESERLERSALDALRTALPPQDPRVVRAEANYARILDDTRRPKEAAAIRAQIEAMSRGFREGGQ